MTSGDNMQPYFLDIHVTQNKTNNILSGKTKMYSQ